MQLLYRCFSTSTHWQALHSTTQALHNTTHVPNRHTPVTTPAEIHLLSTNSSYLTRSSSSTHSFYFLSQAPLATHTENERLTITMIMAYLDQKNWSVRLSLCMYVCNYQLSVLTTPSPSPSLITKHTICFLPDDGFCLHINFGVGHCALHLSTSGPMHTPRVTERTLDT